jgi:anti-sigma regulatory factor (Ser/Thr protein kinase)
VDQIALVQPLAGSLGIGRADYGVDRADFGVTVPPGGTSGRPGPTRIELALPASPASVCIGRRLAAHTLAQWMVPGKPAEDAVLIVSELLTNAIRHGAPPLRLRLRLRLRRGGQELAIEVDDGDRGAAPHKRDASPDAVGGRGLGIVATLSRRWGSRATQSGKTVWSVVAITAGASGQDSAQPAERPALRSL